MFYGFRPPTVREGEGGESVRLDQSAEWRDGKAQAGAHAVAKVAAGGGVLGVGLDEELREGPKVEGGDPWGWFGGWSAGVWGGGGVGV